jgi:RND family efflux transporter MFP subunit
MRGVYILVVILSGMIISILGCSHDHSQSGHTHGPVPEEVNSHVVVHTIWTKNYELFVEYADLVVGDTSRFAVHLTDLQNYKALKKGNLNHRLKSNSEIIYEYKVLSPSSPGIFKTIIVPQSPGSFSFEFIISSSEMNDTIVINEITVHPDQATALSNHIDSNEGNEISFLKEQAWKVDFGVDQIKKQSIHEVIQTSGEILPVRGEEKVVTAKRSGIVFFRSNKLQEGRDIKNGEHLFTITSEGLLQSNLKEKYDVAKARLDQTQNNFERAEELLGQQIIGQKEFEMRKMDYTIAKAEFETLSSGYSESGQVLTAPISGILKSILVKDGQFVEEGTPLVHISRNRKLILQAEVSQKYLQLMPKIKTANFKTPYQKRAFSINEFNGRLVSYGKILEKDKMFIPVQFELDNKGDLLPGSYIEIFLMTNEIENSLVLPKSALMQDYTAKYVYVQKSGEQFEKRQVKTGIDDGVQIQILSGLEEGEWIVTTGAYQIKMASMSNSIPDHGHEH